RGGCQEQIVPMEPFASNLRNRAKELGISNAEAARRVGLSERRYGNYVSGRREPDLRTLVQIAVALQTSPDHLLSFGAVSATDEGDLFEDRIMSAVKALGGTEKKVVAVMIEALASQRG